MTFRLGLAALVALLAAACDGDTSSADPTQTVDVLVDAATTPDTGTPDVAVPTAPDVAGPPAPDAAAPAPNVEAPLWGIPVAVDTAPAADVVEIALEAKPIEHEIVPGVTVTMWAYNGQLPGPTVEARVGDEVVIHFKNSLAEPTTIHWHGLRIPSDMDGTPRVQAPVQPGETFTYRFVVPDAGTFWYHPHVRAHEQLERGLYGALVVREREPVVVDADRVIVLDDILVTDDGIPGFPAGHMEAMHGRSGNVLLTNGVADSLQFEGVRGATERWRIINTANARSMILSVQGASWRVMGTDGGLISFPYQANRLEVAVGQRYDLEVIYDGDDTVRLLSHVLTLDAANNVVEVPIEVAAATLVEPASPLVKAVWPTIAAPQPRPQDLDVNITMNGVALPDGTVEWTLNGLANPTEPLFTFERGATVEMTLSNLAGPEHPFHLHGQFFEVAKREGQPVWDEPGLKDTVLVHGQERVVIRAYMDNPGRWMAHCHILTHAELGMMAEIVVTE